MIITVIIDGEEIEYGKVEKVVISTFEPVMIAANTPYDIIIMDQKKS